MSVVYFTRFITSMGYWYIAATKKGVCRLAINGDEVAFFNALCKDFPVDYIQQKVCDVHFHVIEQLNLYLHGKLRVFDCPLDIRGTSFHKKVWGALMNIPYGTLVTYKDIATAIGMPTACRAVGNANGCNPIPIIIPCHRVIASNGKLGGYSAGLEIKKRLIELELYNIS